MSACAPFSGVDDGDRAGCGKGHDKDIVVAGAGVAVPASHGTSPDSTVSAVARDAGAAGSSSRGWNVVERETGRSAGGYIIGSVDMQFGVDDGAIATDDRAMAA